MAMQMLVMQIRHLHLCRSQNPTFQRLQQLPANLTEAILMTQKNRFEARALNETKTCKLDKKFYCIGYLIWICMSCQYEILYFFLVFEIVECLLRI